MKVEDDLFQQIGKAIVIALICQAFGLLIAALFGFNLYFGPVIGIILVIIVLKILGEDLWNSEEKEIASNG